MSHLYKYIHIINDSFLGNSKVLSNIRDVFIYENQLHYNQTTKFGSVILNNYLDTNEKNALIFSLYNSEKSDFSSSMVDKIDKLFYSNLCLETNFVGISCNILGYNFNNMHFKGMKYSLDYFSVLIDELKNFYYNNQNNTLILIYQENQLKFIEAITVYSPK
jgi:hypothetical protein